MEGDEVDEVSDSLKENVVPQAVKNSDSSSSSSSSVTITKRYL